MLERNELRPFKNIKHLSTFTALLSESYDAISYHHTGMPQTTKLWCSYGYRGLIGRYYYTCTVPVEYGNAVTRHGTLGMFFREQGVK